jgi:hypothetical protein
MAARRPRSAWRGTPRLRPLGTQRKCSSLHGGGALPRRTLHPWGSPLSEAASLSCTAAWRLQLHHLLQCGGRWPGARHWPPPLVGPAPPLSRVAAIMRSASPCRALSCPRRRAPFQPMGVPVGTLCPGCFSSPPGQDEASSSSSSGHAPFLYDIARRLPTPPRTKKKGSTWWGPLDTRVCVL